MLISKAMGLIHDEEAYRMVQNIGGRANRAASEMMDA